MGLTTKDIKELIYTKNGNYSLDKNGSTKTAYPAQHVWDNELKGFGVRVFPTGTKSYIITYRNSQNVKRFFTLGNFPDITVKQARDLAKQKLLEVNQGIDPQFARHEQRKEMSFAELAQQYLSYSKEHKRSWRDDHQRMRDHLLPKLGKHKLSEIKLNRLQLHMAGLREKLSDATVNRCIALVKHMFTMAERWQIIEKSPAQHLILYKEPPSADIVLSPTECQKILEACNVEENIYASAMFKLALLTGRRIGEIRNAKWEDVHIYQDNNGKNKMRLTIHQTKSGEQQHIFLNDMAMKVVNSLPKMLYNPYIIAGQAVGKPIQTYSKAWKRVLSAAQVDYFKPHGLRHNYVSTLIAAGEPMDIVGHLVGHKNSNTTKKYTHHRPDWLQKSTERFGEVINMADKRKI